MHCGLKNWKGKARLNIDIYYIPTVLAFILADMKMYIQWKWEINPLVYVLLDIRKWRKKKTHSSDLLFGHVADVAFQIWEAEGTSILVLSGLETPNWSLILKITG